jgi:sigma-B regulation protein RsbU (phosphoserine phosphatase)
MPTPSIAAVRKKAETLEILVEASEIAASYTTDLNGLLEALRELVRKVVDYKIFAVLLKSEGENVLRIRTAVGHQPKLVRNLRVKIGQGITGAAAKQMRTIIVNDVRNDPRYLASADGVRSEISVPLVARGKLVGVIDLQSTQTGAFGAYERNMLELIGSRFSLAIDTAGLYRAAVRQNRTLTMLSQIAQEFSHILDLEELLQKVSTLIRRQIPYDAFSILLVEKESQLLKHYFGVRHDQRIQWDNMPIGVGLVGSAAQQASPVLVDDTSREPRYVAMVEGIRSEVAVPLMLRDEVIGVLDLECEQVDAFTNEHVRVLTLLAPQIATAIENARLYGEVVTRQDRLSRNLRAARELQKHLLPNKSPAIEGLEIAFRNESAAEVSGDLYDFFPFADKTLGILIGDVSGKGAAAALYGALVSGLLRNLVLDEQSPQALLATANRALLSRKIEARYLTSLYGRWDPENRSLEMSNAGQPRPLLYRQGKVEALDVSGIPLGLLDVSSYESYSLTLAPGDAVVLLSDGITEAENSFRQQFGEHGLTDLVKKHGDSPAADLLSRIFEGVDRFTGSSKLDDDRTVVVVKAT